MLPDDPAELTAGKDYGSEGTAQRYLCASTLGRVVDEAVATAALVTAGEKLAVEVASELVADDKFDDRLAQVKVNLEARIAASPELAGVKVWRWRPSAGGRAYTDAGALAGSN